MFKQRLSSALKWMDRGAALIHPFRPIVIKTYTCMHRYGELFRFLQEIHAAFHLKFNTILSYGCASGEECLTLKQMFPHAKIIGTDILPEMVEKAREFCADEKDITILSYTDFLASKHRFDLVLCMSVLIEYPFQFVPKVEYAPAFEDPARKEAMCNRVLAQLTQKFPFSEFEHITKMLDSKIRSGGIFMLHNANYRFMETRAGAKHYSPIILPGKNFETMPKADKSGKAIMHEHYTEVVFRKRMNSRYRRVRRAVRNRLGLK